MGLEKGTGVVLHARKSAESDLLVTWFTEAWGKRTAVAKRARRLESDLGAVFEPLNRVEVVFYARPRVDLVSQGTLLDGCRAVRQDLSRLGAGLAVGHLLYRLLAAHQAEGEAYRLWLCFLDLLREPSARPETLGLATAVKLLALLGHQPRLARCVQCGKDVEAYSLLLDRGGLLCPSCHSQEGPLVSRSLARSLEMLCRLPLQQAGVLALSGEEVRTAWEGLDRGVAKLAS